MPLMLAILGNLKTVVIAHSHAIGLVVDNFASKE
jgi:hypothetical protein